MWTYQQVNGWLDLNGVLVSKDCYSGQFPGGFNNPKMEGVENVGPIPAGCYVVGRPDNPPYPGKGPYVMRLMPDPPTRARILALGRNPDSFLCHGKPEPPKDIRAGSDGCICADEPTRHRIYQSGDVILYVISGLVAAPDLTGDISI